MISRMTISNFRMMRANRVSLNPFLFLVGPNATGKTTFLDALQFVADVLSSGVTEAVGKRTPNYYDLCFDRSKSIAFALDIELTDDKPRLRYELEVGIQEQAGLRVLRENLFLLPLAEEFPQASLFPPHALDAVIHESTPKGWRKVVSKTREGKDYFRDEKSEWNNVFRFGVDRAALGSMPEDPDRFPVSLAIRDLLKAGARTLALDARKMRAPAKPGMRSQMGLDGSNLPYVVRDLMGRDPVLFQEWVAHIATAVTGLETVDVLERQEDKNLILRAKFRGIHEQPIPSWLLSDGTLRLMALTLLSYAARQDENAIYLIEEPENGLHPLAIQAVFESLSQNVEGNQILCATHSPIFLAHVSLEDTLVFRRHEKGYSIVRHGLEVPELMTGARPESSALELLAAEENRSPGEPADLPAEDGHDQQPQPPSRRKRPPARRKPPEGRNS